MYKREGKYMTDETAELTRGVLKKWKGKRGALIMALHDVQGLHGFVPWDDAVIVAEELGVPIARIYEVLTFYNYFKTKSPGKVIVSVCDGTACHIKGSIAVLEAVQNELEIKDGETTSDELFHIQVVRCLGCCGLAPVVVINGKTYGKVDPITVPKIVKEWRTQMEDK